MADFELHSADRPMFAYRQRLTSVGWWGASFAVAMPIVSVFFYMQYLDSSYEAARLYGMGLGSMADSADGTAMNSAIAGLASALASFAGLIMILIGREHYPVEFSDSRIAETKVAKVSSHDDRNLNENGNLEDRMSKLKADLSAKTKELKA